MKSKASVCVYLLLFKDQKILLSLRKNTGYEDNRWALVAGHQDVGESAMNSLIREAREEIGININLEDLEVLHVMHRKTDRENIDIFMKCKSWQGEIKNEEPHKCGGLKFFALHNLPENISEYNKFAIESALKKNSYSEVGWQNVSKLKSKIN